MRGSVTQSNKNIQRQSLQMKKLVRIGKDYPITIISTLCVTLLLQINQKPMM